METRGRWKKRGRRIVFRYIDPGQAYTDAKVEGLLCVGGPVKYQLKRGLQIHNEWLFQNVVPNIHRRYFNDLHLCKMLGLAVLYASLDEAIHVPRDIRQRVTGAYAALGLDERHPVIKVPLHVYRIDDRLAIDEVIQQNHGGNTVQNGPVAANIAAGIIPNQTLLVKMDRLERYCSDQFSQVHALIERSNRIMVDH